MSDLPLVSLITPCLNQGAFLEETIRSVLDQGYPRLEYLIIDGGSTDGSLDIIRRYADRLAYWTSETDRGQAHAINKGLQRAQGEILGWLNADDVLAPGAIFRAVQVFHQNPAVDVVYGHLERIDAEGNLLPTPELPKDRVLFNKSLVIGECVVNQPGSFWRRRAMERSGLLDEGLHYALDYEYWIRLALDGAQFFRLPETVAYFRLSHASKTVSRTAAMAVEQLGVLEKLLAIPDLPDRLGVSPRQVDEQARRAKARIALHAVYGYAKQSKWLKAARWLSYALNNDPFVVFDKLWWQLAAARLARRNLRRGK